MQVILLLGSIWMGLPESTDDSNSKDTLNTYTNSIGMEFVLIPEGEFPMGSNRGFWDEIFGNYDYEHPVHEVTIEQAYYLGTYEVIQEQWVEIMSDNPSKFKCDNNPVEYVS